MCGEGRGHAARVRTVVERLREEHEFLLLAPGDAHELLAPPYAGSDVRVLRMPGLRYAYALHGRVSGPRTACTTAGYLAALPGLVRSLVRLLERWRPDLAIVDFEPALPRAARRLGVPVVSLDHQHLLAVADLGGFSRDLRWYGRLAGPIVMAHCPRPAARIVSSFAAPPLRRGAPAAEVVGILLRPAVAAAEPGEGGYLLAYVKRTVPPGVLAALAGAGVEVRLQGLGARPPSDGIHFVARDEAAFVADLATCRAVVCTAGNQLVGEALHLGKPVLAFPEPGNAEQRINAHLLRTTGCGETAPAEALDAPLLRGFLDRLDAYRARIVPGRADGTERALELVRAHLP
jgi:uncharacterized protein (TIGR00661 family)